MGNRQNSVVIGAVVECRGQSNGIDVVDLDSKGAPGVVYCNRPIKAAGLNAELLERAECFPCSPPQFGVMALGLKLS